MYESKFKKIEEGRNKSRIVAGSKVLPLILEGWLSEDDTYGDVDYELYFNNVSKNPSPVTFIQRSIKNNRLELKSYKQLANDIQKQINDFDDKIVKLMRLYGFEEK